MKALQVGPAVDLRIQAIISASGNVGGFDTAIARLRSRQKLSSTHFNDHALTGKLAAYRSGVGGTTADGRTVVMVYRVTAHTVIVNMVDEHDAAYRVMREEAYSGKFED